MTDTPSLRALAIKPGDTLAFREESCGVLGTYAAGEEIVVAEVDDDGDPTFHGRFGEDTWTRDNFRLVEPAQGGEDHVGDATEKVAPIPTEQADGAGVGFPGVTVTLVGDAVNGGLFIRKWTNEGLEGGTHDLIPRCLAEREIHRLRMALEAIDALPVMEINLSNYDDNDLAELNGCASQAAIIAGKALGYGSEA